MNNSQKEQFLRHVQKAPSPHNTQPFLWKISDGKIELWVVSERLLHVSDRELRDLQLSAGAACALAELALKELGLKTGNAHFTPVVMKPSGLQKYIEFEYFVGEVEASSELKVAQTRACYRGVFEVQESTMTVKSKNVSISKDQKVKNQVAELYDEAIAYFMVDQAYSSELYKWLRLSKSHVRYYLDGLNAESLRLNPILAFISSFVMRPAVLECLGKLGILKSLISEKPQNVSAEGILILKRDPSQSLFDQGKEMYLTWIELETQGRMFCPITSLIDDKKFEGQLRNLLGSKEEIIHVLRFGKKPEKEILGLTPRISIHEISKSA